MLHVFLLFILLTICLYYIKKVCVCVCIPHSPERVSDLELESQTDVSPQMWVLTPELRASKSSLATEPSPKPHTRMFIVAVTSGIHLDVPHLSNR